tara:strand:+ start:188 stop:613 length:426 start_codon:yes stop_codon:yes gene_type:complete
MFCLDEITNDVERLSTICCEKTACTPCVERWMDRLELRSRGCPLCRSTFGHVWVEFQYTSFAFAELRCDGEYRVIDIPERVRRRYFRNIARRGIDISRNVNDIPAEELDGIAVKLFAEAVDALRPFMETIFVNFPLSFVGK